MWKQDSRTCENKTVEHVKTRQQNIWKQDIRTCENKTAEHVKTSKLSGLLLIKYHAVYLRLVLKLWFFRKTKLKLSNPCFYQVPQFKFRGARVMIEHTNRYTESKTLYILLCILHIYSDKLRIYCFSLHSLIFTLIEFLRSAHFSPTSLYGICNFCAPPPTLEIPSYGPLHTDIFTHRHIYSQTYINTGINKHRHIYTDIYLHRHIFTQTYIYTDIYTHRHINTDRHIFTQTYIHTDI